MNKREEIRKELRSSMRRFVEGLYFKHIEEELKRIEKDEKEVFMRLMII